MKLSEFQKLHNISNTLLHKYFNLAIKQKQTFVLQFTQKTKYVINVEKFIEFINKNQGEICEKKKQDYIREESFIGSRIQVMGYASVNQLKQIIG